MPQWHQEIQCLKQHIRNALLISIKFKKLASKIPLDNDIEPNRPWIADSAKHLSFSLKTLINICEDRFNSASVMIIHIFYGNHSEIIQNCPPQLNS